MAKESDLVKKSLDNDKLLLNFQEQTGIPPRLWAKRGRFKGLSVAVLDPTKIKPNKDEWGEIDSDYLESWYFVRTNTNGRDIEVEIAGKSIYVFPADPNEKPYCFFCSLEQDKKVPLKYTSTKRNIKGKELSQKMYCPSCEPDAPNLPAYQEDSQTSR